MKGRKAKKHFSHLATVKQKSDESLTKFLERWRKEVVEVEGMDDKSAITLFTQELRVGDLYKELRRNAPTSYAKLMAKADLYAKVDEDLRNKMKEDERTSKKPRGEEPPSINRREEPREARRGREWPQDPRARFPERGFRAPRYPPGVQYHECP